jgi:hypothetical protein
MLQEVMEFFKWIRSKFSYPDMFRHMVAILRGSWVPDKLLKQCSVLWACADYVRTITRPMWPVVVECPRHSTTGHTPITQNIAWVAYQALTTPWEWQPYAETCRGRKIWNVLINNPPLPGAFFGLFTNVIFKSFPSGISTLLHVAHHIR